MHDHVNDLVDFAGIWPVMSAMFLTGLVGGFGHCSSMCGPFVMAQVGGAVSMRTSGNGAAVMVRGGQGVLLPYHLGRLTTYAVLGTAVGGLSSLFVRATEFRWMLVAFLGIAAAMFFLQALGGLSRWVPILNRFSIAGKGWSGRAARMIAHPLRRLFADPTGVNAYALGVALGFLPCGFLYAALASATGTGSAIAGLMVMAAFAIGTMPSLMVVGVLGSVAGLRWASTIRAAMPALMLFNAGVLAMTAWHSMITP